MPIFYSSGYYDILSLPSFLSSALSFKIALACSSEGTKSAIFILEACFADSNFYFSVRNPVGKGIWYIFAVRTARLITKVL